MARYAMQMKNAHRMYVVNIVDAEEKLETNVYGTISVHQIRALVLKRFREVNVVYALNEL